MGGAVVATPVSAADGQDPDSGTTGLENPDGDGDAHATVALGGEYADAPTYREAAPLATGDTALDSAHEATAPEACQDGQPPEHQVRDPECAGPEPVVAEPVVAEPVVQQTASSTPTEECGPHSSQESSGGASTTSGRLTQDAPCSTSGAEQLAANPADAELDTGISPQAAEYESADGEAVVLAGPSGLRWFKSTPDGRMLPGPMFDLAQRGGEGTYDVHLVRNESTGELIEVPPEAPAGAAPAGAAPAGAVPVSPDALGTASPLATVAVVHTEGRTTVVRVDESGRTVERLDIDPSAPGAEIDFVAELDAAGNLARMTSTRRVPAAEDLPVSAEQQAAEASAAAQQRNVQIGNLFIDHLRDSGLMDAEEAEKERARAEQLGAEFADGQGQLVLESAHQARLDELLQMSDDHAWEIMRQGYNPSVGLTQEQLGAINKLSRGQDQAARELAWVLATTPGNGVELVVEMSDDQCRFDAEVNGVRTDDPFLRNVVDAGMGCNTSDILRAKNRLERQVKREAGGYGGPVYDQLMAEAGFRWTDDQKYNKAVVRPAVSSPEIRDEISGRLGRHFDMTSKEITYGWDRLALGASTHGATETCGHVTDRLNPYLSQNNFWGCLARSTHGELLEGYRVFAANAENVAIDLASARGDDKAYIYNSSGVEGNLGLGANEWRISSGSSDLDLTLDGGVNTVLTVDTGNGEPVTNLTVDDLRPGFSTLVFAADIENLNASFTASADGGAVEEVYLLSGRELANSCLDLGDGGDRFANLGGTVRDLCLDLGPGDDRLDADGAFYNTSVDLDKGKDLVVVHDDYEGDASVLDGYRSWLWAKDIPRLQNGNSRVLREEDTVLLAGDWDLEGDSLVRRGADGAAEARLELDGNTANIERIQAFDPETGRIVETLQSNDPDIRESLKFLKQAGFALKVIAPFSGPLAPALYAGGTVAESTFAVANGYASVGDVAPSVALGIGSAFGLPSYVPQAYGAINAAADGRIPDAVANGLSAASSFSVSSPNYFPETANTLSTLADSVRLANAVGASDTAGALYNLGNIVGDNSTGATIDTGMTTPAGDPLFTTHNPIEGLLRGAATGIDLADGRLDAREVTQAATAFSDLTGVDLHQAVSSGMGLPAGNQRLVDASGTEYILVGDDVLYLDRQPVGVLGPEGQFVSPFTGEPFQPQTRMDDSAATTTPDLGSWTTPEMSVTGQAPADPAMSLSAGADLTREQSSDLDQTLRQDGSGETQAPAGVVGDDLGPTPSLRDDPGVLIASLPGMPVDFLAGGPGVSPQLPEAVVQPTATTPGTTVLASAGGSGRRFIGQDPESGSEVPLVPVPDSWEPKSSKKGKGIQFINPEQPNERIRIMSEGTESRNPGGYVKYQDAGGRSRDADDNVVSSDADEAHFPGGEQRRVSWLDRLFQVTRVDSGIGGTQFPHPLPPAGGPSGSLPPGVPGPADGGVVIQDAGDFVLTDDFDTPPEGAAPGGVIVDVVPPAAGPQIYTFPQPAEGGGDSGILAIEGHEHAAGDPAAVPVVGVERARVVVADGVRSLRERGLSTAEGVVIDAGSASVSAVLNSVQGREWLRELGVSAPEVAAVLGVAYDPGAVGSALVGPGIAQPVAAEPVVPWDGSVVDPADLFGEQFAGYGQGEPASAPSVVPQAQVGTEATGAVDAGAVALFEAYGQLASAADPATVTVQDAPGLGQQAATHAGRVSEQFVQDTLAYVDWLGRSFSTENFAAANEEANQAWRDTPSQVTAAGGFLGIGNHTFTAVFGNDPAAVREGTYQVDPNNRQQARLVAGDGPLVLPTGVLRIVAAQPDTSTPVPATPAAPPTTTPITTPITTPPAPLPLRIPATP